jgi:glucokinase
MEVIRQEALEPARLVCKVVPAALGEQVGDYASISVAIVGKTNKNNI